MMADPDLDPLPLPLARLSAAQLDYVDDALARFLERYALVNSLQLEVARVFMQHCSPRDANELGLRLATHYLLWFFAFDDMPDDSKKHADLVRAHRVINGVSEPESPLDVATRDLCTSLRELLGGGDTSRLFDFMNALVASFIWETERSERTPPIDLYMKNREHTIAVYPYLEMFRLAGGAKPRLDEWETIRELERLCVTGVYLTNDILSVKRDLRKNNHNLVLGIANELDIDHGEALQRTKEMLTQTIADFLKLQKSALEHERHSSSTSSYVEYLGTMLEGNRVATLLCAERFLGNG